MGNVDEYGYIRIGGKKQIMLHRAIMEEVLGRKLKTNELVHHKNGDKFDSRPSNLEIVSRSKHMEIHQREHKKLYYDIDWLKEQIKYGIKGKEIARKCGVTPQAICQFKRKHLYGIPYSR